MPVKPETPIKPETPTIPALPANPTAPTQRYTVKQMADFANVSVRTLHYYDEVGLLTPSQVGTNGYRYLSVL